MFAALFLLPTDDRVSLPSSSNRGERRGRRRRRKDLLKMDSSAFPRISFFPLPAAEEGKNLERFFLEEEETKVVSPRSRLVIRQLFSTR